MSPSLNILDQSDIYIGDCSTLLPSLLPEEGRVVVVTDPTVAELYRSLLEPYQKVIIPQGERNKTLQTVEALYRRLMELGVDRKTFILAVGGGIVTDVAGFAASTYMRGLRFGFVATTLMAQIDAAIGGKNGVDIDGYKNMAGTFTHPQFVICDSAMLHTLPEREFRAGLAEVVKSAIIADADLFADLEAAAFDELRADTDRIMEDVISATVRIKADLVEADERDLDERRKLNLGHTFAHAIEKCSDKMVHGEAVAVGTALIAHAAVKLGVLQQADCDRIAALLEKFGFVLTPPVAMKELLAAIDKDKKRTDGVLNVVLPAGIGDCEVRPIPMAEFAALFV